MRRAGPSGVSPVAEEEGDVADAGARARASASRRPRRRPSGWEHQVVEPVVTVHETEPLARASDQRPAYARDRAQRLHVLRAEQTAEPVDDGLDGVGRRAESSMVGVLRAGEAQAVHVEQRAGPHQRGPCSPATFVDGSRGLGRRAPDDLVALLGGRQVLQQQREVRRCRVVGDRGVVGRRRSHLQGRQQRPVERDLDGIGAVRGSCGRRRPAVGSLASTVAGRPGSPRSSRRWHTPI